MYKKKSTPQPSGIYSRFAQLAQYLKKINVIHHINRLKKKSHMTISIDAEKAFDKIQYPFMIKVVSKLGIEGNLLDLIKNTYESPQLTSHLVVRNQLLSC